MPRNIVMISAIAKNRAIWKDNKIPWYLPEDLKRFRTMIKWKKVVMWYSTYLSLQWYFPKTNWLLPNVEETLILTRKRLLIKWAKIFSNIESVLDYIWENELWVVWWARTYESFLPYATKLELTIFKKNIDWDTFFPDYNNWERVETHAEDWLDEDTEYVTLQKE